MKQEEILKKLESAKIKDLYSISWDRGNGKIKRDGYFSGFSKNNSPLFIYDYNSKAQILVLSNIGYENILSLERSFDIPK